MRTTPILCGPPVFRFWKDFGAPKRRKIPWYKQWWDIWRGQIARKKVLDCTLPISQLPPGSRVMDAEDFLKGHIDDLPEKLLRDREEKIVYDHPWPYNISINPILSQNLQHCYKIDTRFFVPREDSLVLTNTLLETDTLQANSPVEVNNQHINHIKRQFEWATKGDSVLVRLPRKREFPKINIKPMSTFGLTKERQEVNVMNSLFDFSQTLLAQHYHKLNEQTLDELLQRRSIAFPHCNVPYKRQDRQMNLELCIDSMSISNLPIPPIDSKPHLTKEREPINIQPRSWKSLLEQSRNFTPNWSFTLPKNSFLHTIQLASRIKRELRNDDEMLARSLVHAFGLTSQFARLKYHEKVEGSNIMHDPILVNGVDDQDLLEEPIVLQIIGFELPKGNFHFTRFQLNSLKFDDTKGSGVKNQAWYSGPINDLGEALKYYLDFQAQSKSRDLVSLESRARASSH